MDMDETLLDAEERMQKAVSVFADGLKGMRAGTANPGLVENIRVDYYGSKTPLKQIANIGVPDAQLIVIKPYDPGSLDDIVKAIQKSDLGIHPQNDGKMIRLAVPGLSEERRNQLVNRIGETAEDARVAIRNIRRDANKQLNKMEKDSDISEDDCRRGQEHIQEITDEYTGKIDDMLQKKTADIRQV
ncbi:MAG: ribosome recycling factor [Planctomycetota bacterium]